VSMTVQFSRRFKAGAQIHAYGMGTPDCLETLHRPCADFNFYGQLASFKWNCQWRTHRVLRLPP
jgi:hypothetical protein